MEGNERAHRDWLRDHGWRWDGRDHEWWTNRSDVAAELEAITAQWADYFPSALMETQAERDFAKKIGCQTE